MSTQKSEKNDGGAPDNAHSVQSGGNYYPAIGNFVYTVRAFGSAAAAKLHAKSLIGTKDFDPIDGWAPLDGLADSASHPDSDVRGATKKVDDWLKAYEKQEKRYQEIAMRHVQVLAENAAYKGEVNALLVQRDELLVAIRKAQSLAKGRHICRILRAAIAKAEAGAGND
jgi:hypothetical protein